MVHCVYILISYPVPSKVIIREAMTGHSTSVLVPAVASASSSIPQKRGTLASYFSAHVYCGQTVAYLSYS